jgi:phosphoenolpyruvate carboxykinase (GTP)
MPKVFYVNWFRKNAEGKWLWPGFGENSRILKWVCERVDGKGEVTKTAIGNLPTAASLDLAGLDIPAEDLAELLKVDASEWLAVVPQMEEHFAKFGNKLPAEIKAQLEALKARLEAAK